MALSLRFVQQLDHVIEPVVARLQDNIADRDLFETDFIVVPNAGVRAWLLQKLAYSLGASTDRNDGVVANVEVGFIGMLDKFVMPGSRAHDPWGVDYLTFAVLRAIHDLSADHEVQSNIARLGGGLKAARTMADRFDRYHARRPLMIRRWEDGEPTLSPFIGEDTVVDELGVREAVLAAPPLADVDKWQFTLWTRVRQLIGMASPPARTAEALQQLAAGSSLPNRITIVGLQSLSQRHLETILALADVSDIGVVMVHPSPELVSYWSGQFATRPVARNIAIARPPVVSIPDKYNSMVYSWLRGSMDLQHMLAVNGVPVAPYQAESTTEATTLLGHVKRAIAEPSGVTKHPIDDGDQSLLVHRAHNLARQVEVLHDAVLHAFDQLPKLQPHEVVIVSPDIAAVAPLLQATFQRSVINSTGQTFTLPIVVADRGLREVDEGSRLLADLLMLLRSRFGISDVLSVITSPLVLKRFQLGADDVETWKRYIEQARVRWGIDDTHRFNSWKVNLGAEGLAHTWALAIKRSLLGATLPDAATPRIELGGVVPMIDVEPNEMRAITALAEVMSILADAQKLVSSDRSVREWCGIVEDTLSRLAFGERGELDEALESVTHFVRHSTIPTSDAGLDVDVDVEFAHVASLISEQLTAAPGRQPLRTGAITATSTIPLRSVPFRVVCIVGMDDGVFGAGDAEGDDLESRQQLIGDSDARLDQRRTLLDSIVAAEDRVIITCVGRSIKNNVLTPLVTPLAELVELCGALGAGKNSEHSELSAIEVLHPRHFNGPKNFGKGQLVHGLVWSHSRAALAAAQPVAQLDEPADSSGLVDVPELPIISLDTLEQLIADPLRVFVSGTLGINTWRDSRDEEPAVIPLKVQPREYRELAKSLYVGLDEGVSEKEWEAAAIAGGQLPPGQYRVSTITNIKELVDHMRQRLSTLQHASVEDVDVVLPLPNGQVIRGRIPGVCTRDDGSRFILRVDFGTDKDKYTRTLPLHMMILAALDKPVDAAYFVMQHEKKPNESSGRFMDPQVQFTRDNVLDRLLGMVALLDVARAMPCPSFNGAAALAATDRDAASDKFQQFISDRYEYKYSLELMLYGSAPFFDDVLPDGSPVIDFWTTLMDVAPHDDGNARAAGGFQRYRFS